MFEITDVNRYAAQFMTITCDVQAAVARAYPGGRARRRHRAAADHRAFVNPLYYDILRPSNATRPALPALVNTSFNVHEEPIVNRPEECIRALQDGRIDFVVTGKSLYRRE